jgi:hypothetical protein
MDYDDPDERVACENCGDLFSGCEGTDNESGWCLCWQVGVCPECYGSMSVMTGTAPPC